MDFLYCVWAFNKNYEKIKKAQQQQDELDGGDSDYDFGETYTTFTYEWLIGLIIEITDESTEDLIINLANWKLVSNENFLISLLKNR